MSKNISFKQKNARTPNTVLKIELPKARRRGANNTAKCAEIRIDSSLWTTCEATKPLPTISAIFERAWPYAGYIFNNTVQESNINEVMNRAKYANTGFVATVRRALNLLQSRLLILNCVYKRKVYWPLRFLWRMNFTLNIRPLLFVSSVTLRYASLNVLNLTRGTRAFPRDEV